MKWREDAAKRKEYAKRYYQAHKKNWKHLNRSVERRAYMKRYREERAEELRAYRQRYYRENRAVILERVKQSRQKHREKTNARQRRYYRQNPQRYEVYSNRYKQTRARWYLATKEARRAKAQAYRARPEVKLRRALAARLARASDRVKAREISRRSYWKHHAARQRERKKYAEKLRDGYVAGLLRIPLAQVSGELLAAKRGILAVKRALRAK